MTFARLTERRGLGARAETHAPADVVFSSRVPDGAVYARRSLLDADVLTSVREETFQTAIGGAPADQIQLTRDNPLLGDPAKRRLDDRGVIQRGVRVCAGDALWSCIRRIPAAQGKRKKERQEDYSRFVPAHWDGALVTDVDYTDGKKDFEIAVTLRLEHPLSVGDGLFLADGYLGVLAKELDDDDADALRPDGELYASMAAAERLGILERAVFQAPVAKSERVAVALAQPRRGGPFSLINQQPLNRGQPAQAQTIAPRHARWLLERGFTEILAEFASLKCDELSSRAALDDFAAGKIPRAKLPDPGTPMSRWLFQSNLMAMGLAVEIAGDAAPALRIRPALRDEVLAASSGQVRKPETLNYRTYDGEPGGLFCPTIFGERRTRFGHVELAAPITPYWWRCGSPSVLDRILPATGEQLNKLATCEQFVRLDGSQLTWGDYAATTGDPENWLTGGEAIRRLLEEFAPAELPAGLAHGAAALACDALLVLPAPLRPIVPLDSGNFATSDLNDLYRRVINRNNRIGKLIELKAPPVILQNERRMLQLSIDALFANSLLPKRAQVLGADNRPLKSLVDLCLAELTEPQSKRVAWSAPCRAVADGDVSGGHAILPRNIYEGLRLSAEVPVLLTLFDGAEFAALLPEADDAAVVRLPPGAVKALALATDRDELVSLHAPLRPAAVEEARRLHRGAFQVRPIAAQDTWLQPGAGATLTDIIAGMVRAAMSYEPTPLITPSTALLSGMGGAPFTEPSESAS